MINFSECILEKKLLFSPVDSIKDKLFRSFYCFQSIQHFSPFSINEKSWLL